ncbi:MAG: hypothetical protein Kow00128_17650 [Deltaproteobacteria bacterium]
MGAVREIHEADFDREVLAAGAPVLVDFFTPPCAPCKALLPVLERVAGKHPGLRVFKVNAWDNGALCSRFRIVGVPALLFFHRGENVLRMEGFDESTEARIEEGLKGLLEG